MGGLIRDGDLGTSLFILAAGKVEVLRRIEDGSDLHISNLGAGSVLGEISLLTGLPRSATVRADEDGALVFEIAEESYRPLIMAHPEWLDELAALMDERMANEREVLSSQKNPSIRDRIRLRFFAA
jgi:CRP-like cAMP-binding protein